MFVKNAVKPESTEKNTELSTNNPNGNDIISMLLPKGRLFTISNITKSINEIEKSIFQLIFLKRKKKITGTILK